MLAEMIRSTDGQAIFRIKVGFSSVAQGDGIAALQMRALNRLESWRSGLVHPAKGFVSQPEPRTIGLFARGRQLIAGNVLLAGFLVEAKDAS